MISNSVSNKNWIFKKYNEQDVTFYKENYSLDENTKKWIWLVHNFVFYVNERNSTKRKEKYVTESGLSEMLSDIFLNIGGLSSNLNSDRFEYLHRYPKKEHWKDFLIEVDKAVHKDYGKAIFDKFNSGFNKSASAF